MIDKLILTIMTLALICGTHFVSYELGKKAMCTSDKNYAWSFDYGKCIKVGVENMK
jgi:hypothetical protein